MAKIIKFPGTPRGQIDLDDPDRPMRELAPDLIFGSQIILWLFTVAHLTFGAGGLVHGLFTAGAAAWLPWVAGGVLATAWIPGLLAWRLQEPWARWAGVCYLCLMIMLFVL